MGHLRHADAATGSGSQDATDVSADKQHARAIQPAGMMMVWPAPILPQALTVDHSTSMRSVRDDAALAYAALPLMVAAAPTPPLALLPPPRFLMLRYESCVGARGRRRIAVDSQRSTVNERAQPAGRIGLLLPRHDAPVTDVESGTLGGRPHLPHTSAHAHTRHHTLVTCAAAMVPHHLVTAHASAP
jgi:hypothetical protein